MLYEVITEKTNSEMPEAAKIVIQGVGNLKTEKLDLESVITSYSIHYTKLYDWLFTSVTGGRINEGSG